MRFFIASLLTVTVGCATQPATAPAEPRPVETNASTAAPSGGYILEPHEGEPIIFCDKPELQVNIKVSPETTGNRGLAVGTAELRGSNAGTHGNENEVVYFLSGSGSAFVGETTMRIRPGVTMYVPRGVRHGFASEGDEPVRFFWAISPGGLEERFRADGRPASVGCGAVAPPE